jgi:DNA-binding PadR family transcriptional regulator
MTYAFRRFAQREYWHGFGPMGRMTRFFRAGEVRLALLSLLSEQPQHGYELMRQIERRSGGIYQASAGTIYPTLQQLEDEGLIAAAMSDGKRVYRLTEAGRRELQSEQETVRQIWRRAERWQEWRCVLDPETAELRDPAERLVKAAFKAAAGNLRGHERIQRIRTILEHALRELEELSS